MWFNIEIVNILSGVWYFFSVVVFLLVLNIFWAFVGLLWCFEVVGDIVWEFTLFVYEFIISVDLNWLFRSEKFFFLFEF